jgi:GTP-binding protein
LVPLLRAVAVMVRDARKARAEAEEAESLPVIDTTYLPDFWTVQSEDQGIFRVTGERIEGFARRTNFDQDAAVERLRDILRKIGVAKELRRQGVRDGDKVVIGQSELSWYN